MIKTISKLILLVVTSTFSFLAFTSINTQAVTNLAISPVFECGIDRGDGNYTAVFGYLNRNDEVINVPVGNNNRFSPLPIDRGQTVDFQVGRQYAIFGVTAPNSVNLVWRLAYPTARTATGSYSGTLAKPCSATVAANFPY